MAVSHEELYEQVWAEPMLKVGERHGVSSSFLARVCERLNVPRPPRGLKVGQKPKRPALPPARPNDDLEWTRGHEPRRPRKALPEAPELGARRRRSRGGEQPTRHALLVGARPHFDKVRVSDAGYLRPTKRRLVDVFVSKAALERTLEFANTLFLAFEARGHQVAFAPPTQYLHRPDIDERSEPKGERYSYYQIGRWAPDRATIVYVGTVGIGLTLFELSENVEVKYVDGKYLRVDELPIVKRLARSAREWTTQRDLPSGRLCLRATSPYSGAAWEKQWREAKPGDVEKKTASIVRELEKAAVEIAELVKEEQRRAEIRHQEWEVKQCEWARQEAERRRVQNIKDSREELFKIVESWGLTIQIEHFFEDAKRRAAALPDEERLAIEQRLQRGRELLGGVDPQERFRAWRVPEER